MQGTLKSPTPTRLVHAGALTAEYEKGELRYIRVGETEVIRRIYVAVRDRSWKTIPVQVQESVFEAQGNSFRIGLVARHELADIIFEWRGGIIGSPDSTIRLEME